MVAITHEHESRRFSVLPDGTVRGDDGTHGRLAASVRYAARLAAQVELLLDVGTLQQLSTVSSEVLEVRVSRDDDGEVGLTVRIDAAPARRPKALTVVGGADVHAALTHCVQRVQQVPGVQWAAIVDDAKRVVGVSLPHVGASVVESVSALPNVGARALAILDAIDEPLRESWVEVGYDRATLVVASLGAGCVFAVVDEVRATPFGEALDEVRAVLAAYDLGLADPLSAGIDDLADESEVEPGVVEPTPAPAGMRYRAVTPRAPRTARTARRGFRRGADRVDETTTEG